MSVWFQILEGPELAFFRTDLLAKLAETADLWEPYRTLDNVIDDIDNGMCQVWAGGIAGDTLIRIWGLTSFVTYHSGKKSVRIMWCAGEDGPEYYEGWTKQVELLAEQLGAEFVEINGRLGWSRIFAPMDYKPKYVNLIKDISHVGRRQRERHADEQG